MPLHVVHRSVAIRREPVRKPRLVLGKLRAADPELLKPELDAELLDVGG